MRYMLPCLLLYYKNRPTQLNVTCIQLKDLLAMIRNIFMHGG